MMWCKVTGAWHSFNHQPCAFIDQSDHVQQPRDSSFSRRVCSNNFIASQSLGSCCTRHVPNKYLHGTQMFHPCWLTSCLQQYLTFFYSEWSHALQDWMFWTHMHVLFFPPYVQTRASGSSWNLAPQATGCKRSGRFHQPDNRCNVTGKTLGAHRLTHYCGHLVQ